MWHNVDTFLEHGLVQSWLLAVLIVVVVVVGILVDTAATPGYVGLAELDHLQQVQQQGDAVVRFTDEFLQKTVV